ncbi:MAG TPA: queuosine precursor transporter [Terracidiphilus sp.]|nr:queuosine precursor transporter [Terracidiphilus sp.]
MTRRFHYLDIITIGFVAVLLVSNLVGPKICRLGPLRPSAAEFLFPLTYICGDVFTEVYGYGASRRAIWMGFLAMAMLALTGQFAVMLPPAPEWHGQQAFATVFSLVPRFAAASLVAYFAGEFTNSYTLAKLKLLTRGRWLWTRTVGSTITGQAVDTVVVVVVAFAGTLPPAMLLRITASSYLIKVAVEVLATPLTYLVVGWLKRVEESDVYDDQTDFNPFHFQNENA